MRFKRILLGTLAAGAAFSAQAALEDFTGYSGSLFGENGGSASGGISWTASWSDQGFGTSADLIGGALGTVNTVTSLDPFAERILGNPGLESTRTLTLQQNQVVYVWGLLSFGDGGPDAFDPSNSFAGMGLFEGSTEKFLIGQRFGQANWGVATGNLNGSGQDGTIAIGDFNVALILAKIDQPNDDLTFWVNPNFLLTEGANTPAFTFDYGANDDDFDTVRIRGGNSDNGNTYQYDNLNITTISPFGAIPEPSTLAFIGMALLGIAFRRRLIR